MNRNRKKVLICFGTFVAVLLIVSIVGAWTMFGTFVIAANSIDNLEDGLYSMEYEGDYGFDEFLAEGGAASDSAVADYLVSFLSHGFYRLLLSGISDA